MPDQPAQSDQPDSPGFVASFVQTLKRAGWTVGQSLKTMGRHIGVVLAVCVALAALRAPVDHLLFDSIIGAGNSLGSSQEEMIKYVLIDTGFLLLARVLLGPILAGVAVYLARRDQVGKPSTAGGAVSFALRRYKALFLPHLAAEISIQVGLQLLIFPGIIFYGMYAFVAPVACLEEGEWPLDRSKALTRGRRGTIYWITTPLVIAILAKSYLVDLKLLDQGLVVLFANDVGNALIEFFVYAAFAWLYLDRVTPKGQPAAESPDAADSIAESPAG